MVVKGRLICSEIDIDVRIRDVLEKEILGNDSKVVGYARRTHHCFAKTKGILYT
jgi:hypothetical protein